jgi:hypothetical protein
MVLTLKREAFAVAGRIKRAADDLDGSKYAG